MQHTPPFWESVKVTKLHVWHHYLFSYIFLPHKFRVWLNRTDTLWYRINLFMYKWKDFGPPVSTAGSPQNLIWKGMDKFIDFLPNWRSAAMWIADLIVTLFSKSSHGGGGRSSLRWLLMISCESSASMVIFLCGTTGVLQYEPIIWKTQVLMHIVNHTVLRSATLYSFVHLYSQASK